MDIIPAASSSVGSNIFAVLSLLTISLLVLLLLRHYLPLRTTPSYLLIPVFLALALPSSIILLVPIDLASATSSTTDNPNRGVWLPEAVVLVTWRITYWLTFCLTWFILPLLGEYVDSGYRDGKSRMVYSLRSNVRYQLMYLGTAVAGLVYFIFQNGLHTASIKGLVMALAYGWGLVLAIGLMGHGLVALPRRLYMNAKVSTRLRRLQGQAPKTKDKLDEATDELEDLENTVWQLKQRKHGASADLQEWIDELADTTAIPDGRSGAAAAVRASNTNIPAVVTERYLADLTRKLKRARHKKARFVDEWSHLCQHAHDTQTILDSATTKKLDFGRSTPSWSSFAVLTPSLRYQLYMTIIPSTRIAASVLLGVASITLVFSEVVKSFAPQVSVIGLTIVHHPSSPNGKIESGATAHLSSDRPTPKARAGKLVDLTPLGQGFSAFFPCFLLLPVLASLFNVYGRMKKIIGFGVLEDESEANVSGFGTGGWREGRALIERELLSRGGEASAVGLTSRNSTSLDLDRRAGGAAGAGMSTPPIGAAARGRASQREALLPTHIQDANRQFNSITNREEPVEEDDGPRRFYHDFAERVRNTIDAPDRPEWVRSIGSALATTPKWMQNEQQTDRSGGGSVFDRLFGGRADDGRVRL
ncbi:hypothetical protein LTR87_003944 [Friedmanniomyces endolithicus]|nr:hypothetical protein LTR87_003944 [Friedmanniomyces endolithicus]